MELELPSGYVSATADDMIVETNTTTADNLADNLAGDDIEVSSTSDPAPTPDDGPVVAESKAEKADEPEAPPKIDKRTREGRKQSIQEEIDALTAQKHAAKRELEQARADAAALKAEREQAAAERQRAAQPAAPAQPAPQAARPAASADDPEPTLEQFATDPDPYTAHIKAAARWEARQEMKQERERARVQYERQQAQQAELSRVQGWQDTLSKYREKNPDFDTRLDPSVPISTPMRDLIFDSPVGPELLLHLSAHKDLAQRLSTLHPIQVIREMGRLEARLEAASTSGPASSAPAISKAIPPVKPLGSSAPSTEDAISDDASVEAHIRHYNKAERARRR